MKLIDIEKEYFINEKLAKKYNAITRFLEKNKNVVYEAGAINKLITNVEYKMFKNNVKTIAEAIRQNLKNTQGLFFETRNILPEATEETNKDWVYLRSFIIQELKKMGLEFRENSKYYRVVE